MIKAKSALRNCRGVTVQWPDMTGATFTPFIFINNNSVNNSRARGSLLRFEMWNFRMDTPVDCGRFHTTPVLASCKHKIDKWQRSITNGGIQMYELPHSRSPNFVGLQLRWLSLSLVLFLVRKKKLCLHSLTANALRNLREVSTLVRTFSLADSPAYLAGSPWYKPICDSLKMRDSARAVP